jgi:hypothetical protein
LNCTLSPARVITMMHHRCMTTDVTNTSVHSPTISSSLLTFAPIGSSARVTANVQ